MKALMVTNTVLFTKKFNMRNIAMLQSLGYEVHVAANFDAVSNFNQNGNDSLKSELSSMGVKCFHIDFGRNVKDFSGIKRAYDELLAVVKNNDYQLMHCHNPIPGVIARLVAKKTGIPIIYTAHGFHFFKGASKVNWMLFYPVEKFCSRYTDVLITINQEDYQLAKKQMKAKKIVYIPGIGMNLAPFQEKYNYCEEKRKKLGLSTSDIMLLSVGELIPRKNHAVMIEALAKMKNEKIYYVICGAGAIKEELISLAQKLGVEKQVKLLGYRTDIKELCYTTDIYIFPSLQEGLPVALMEAMACGNSCIVSDIRGNNELIENGKGGFLVNPSSPDEFAEKISLLLSDPTLIEMMGRYNQQKIKQFDCKIVDEKMLEIYQGITQKTSVFNDEHKHSHA